VVAGLVDEPGQPHAVGQPGGGATRHESFHCRVIRRYGSRF
jgi:hypothetical protein